MESTSNGPVRQPMTHTEEPPIELYAKTLTLANTLIDKIVEQQPLFDKLAKGDEATAYGALVTKMSTSMNQDELAIALAAAIRRLYGGPGQDPS